MTMAPPLVHAQTTVMDDGEVFVRCEGCRRYGRPGQLHECDGISGWFGRSNYAVTIASLRRREAVAARGCRPTEV